MASSSEPHFGSLSAFHISTHIVLKLRCSVSVISQELDNDQRVYSTGKI